MVKLQGVVYGDGKSAPLQSREKWEVRRAGGPSLRFWFWQRLGLMQPASRFSSRPRPTDFSHQQKAAVGQPPGFVNNPLGFKNLCNLDEPVK
jgi:hypothetical protein